MTAVMFLAAQMPAFAGEWRGMLRRELETGGNPSGAAGAGVAQRLADVSRSGAGRGDELGGGHGGRAGPGRAGVRPKALAPNWKRLDPVSHVEQLFSLAALSRLLKSLLPTAVVVYFAVGVLVRDFRFFPALLHGSRQRLMAFTVGRMYEVAWKGSLVLLLWAGADYFLERQRHETN
jgi:hypothetical protein